LLKKEPPGRVNFLQQQAKFDDFIDISTTNARMKPWA